uniref:Uncharacterized protein n=1 Tax=Globodera rostochiensis TaxID=31243 RepID=A0A914I729_GLORO
MMSLCPFVLPLPTIVLILLSSSLLAMAKPSDIDDFDTDGVTNATQPTQQQQQQQQQGQGQGQGTSSSDELVVDVTFDETSPKTNESLREKGKKAKEEGEPFVCSALCWVLIIVCGVTIGAIGVSTIVLFTVRYHKTRGQIDQQGVQMNTIPRSSTR